MDGYNSFDQVVAVSLIGALQPNSGDGSYNPYCMYDGRLSVDLNYIDQIPPIDSVANAPPIEMLIGWIKKSASPGMLDPVAPAITYYLDQLVYPEDDRLDGSDISDSVLLECLYTTLDVLGQWQLWVVNLDPDSTALFVTLTLYNRMLMALIAFLKNGGSKSGSLFYLARSILSQWASYFSLYNSKQWGVFDLAIRAQEFSLFHALISLSLVERPPISTVADTEKSPVDLLNDIIQPVLEAVSYILDSNGGIDAPEPTA